MCTIVIVLGYTNDHDRDQKMLFPAKHLDVVILLFLLAYLIVARFAHCAAFVLSMRIPRCTGTRQQIGRLASKCTAFFVDEDVVERQQIEIA